MLLLSIGSLFIWEILEECLDKETLDLAECKWINKFNSIENGFNLQTGGSNGKHSEETKLIMSKIKIGHKNPMYRNERLLDW